MLGADMTAVAPRDARSLRSQVSAHRALGQAMLAGAALALLLGAAVVPASAACNKAITVTETQQMNYGTIAVTSGGGTVTMATTGTVSAPGGFTVSGITNAGSFHVTGTNNCTVSISFVAGSLTGPGTAMQIQNFTTNAGSTPILNPAGGVLDFNVGADLIVNASQLGGSYSGTYTVTVIY
jgi:Mat/Ecp fimbriae major subunit